eukprot:TRINITY_DN29645_c0_g1_i1.p2 TRINITY_DN29645_c0_g1~~TRINITY_DN29645_c0_g1_i1.p2  ORF type:complete len:120 (+),score=30.90 TRINITY_DN29645_c0_g1_i1:170-529(+)
MCIRDRSTQSTWGSWDGELKDVLSHLKTCSNFERPCKYWYIGCKFVAQIKWHENHKTKDFDKHIEIIKTTLENSTIPVEGFKTVDIEDEKKVILEYLACLLYTSPSPRDLSTSRMPSSA